MFEDRQGGDSRVLMPLSGNSRGKQLQNEGGGLQVKAAVLANYE